MDQNAIVFGLIIAVFVLMALMLILRPWYLRSVMTTEMKEEIKEKKMKAQVAEGLAQKYEKKGRI